MNLKILGAILIVIGALITGTVLYRNSQKSQQSIVFSPTFMLGALWNTYKQEYWDANTGRTIDWQRNSITTSEGQSYTLLRAVWQDDKATFDKTWQWTQSNLQRPNDHLFSWLYGQRTDKSYGVLVDQGGGNSATDADTDIATALLFASSRWQDPAYAQAAQSIISDIWDNEVVTINGIPYVTADNLEKDSKDTALINPSYLAPYAYRLFAEVDPAHDWNAVVNSSYDILSKASAANLDKPHSSGLPPDWIKIDKRTGQISAPAGNNLTTNYGFDALRVPYRLALDWQWNADSRARQVLDKFSFLGQQWQDSKALHATYSHDGQVITNTEVPAMYGGSLGYFLVAQPQTADEVYKAKLQSLYSPDFQDWKARPGYYDDNWAWFGLALYNQDLPDLFHKPQTSARTFPPYISTTGMIIPEEPKLYPQR